MTRDLSTQDEHTLEEMDPALAGEASVLEAGVARERARMALFGEQHVHHKIDRFTLLERVGTGGMGAVYAAYDPRLDRRVAVKLVRTRTDEDGERGSDRRRIVAEARAMARVSHANTVTVYEVGVHRERDRAVVWIAMEFVHGRTLRRWLADERPDWARIIDVFVAAGRGLAAVHKAGLVHRDFKPDNVMIDQDHRVRVMDFGLARDTGVLESTAPMPSAAATLIEQLTRTGALLGTPAYMAPEQFEGAGADHFSDQYAFCVALYEALWGSRPIEAKTPAELVLKMIAAEDPPEPPRGRVPNRIRAAVRRGLARRPEARWPTMDALLMALQPRRNRRRVAAWVGLGAVTLGGLALAMPSRRSDPCGGAQAAFGDAWDHARAQSLRERFVATGVAFAEPTARDVTTRLHAYRDAWLSEHRAACEATQIHHTQSELTLDRRMRCLDRRHRELVALVHAMTQADATVVEHASDATARLVDPHHCSEPAFLDAIAEPPGDPALAATVDELAAKLDEASALEDIGRMPAALAIVRELLPRVQDVPYPPIRAQIEVAAGRLLFGEDDFDAAFAMTRRGYLTAREAHLSRAAFDAALELASMAITATNDYDAGELWLELARVEIEASELTDLADQHLAARIDLAERRGEYDDALALAQELLHRQQTRCKEDCEGLGNTHRMLSLMHAHLGRQADSLEHARLSLAVEERRYGPDHPHVATALMRLGDTLAVGGRSDEAVPLLQRALAIREKVLAPDHPNTVTTRCILGDALVSIGRHEEGLQEIAVAVASSRASSSPMNLAMVLSRYASALEDLGRLDEAEANYKEAFALIHAANPDGHPVLAVLRSNIGLIADRRGDSEQALLDFTAALELRRATVSGPDLTQALTLSNIAAVQLELDRVDDARIALREAVEMTADTTHAKVTTMVRLKLASLEYTRDPAEAHRLVDDAEARCTTVDEATRRVTDCDAIPQWRTDHPR